MLKAVLKYDFLKKVPVFLLMLFIIFGTKFCIAHNFDNEYVQIENQFACSVTGLNPGEAKNAIQQSTDKMLIDALHNYSGVLCDEKVNKITQVSSEVISAIERCVELAYDNINSANGNENRYTYPSEYFTSNQEAYKNLSYPFAVGNMSWSNFFTLCDMNLMIYFAFIVVAVIFVRPYEDGICDADKLTKYGVNYHCIRFIFFLVIIITVSFINFATDIMISDVLNSVSDIFSASIRGTERFCDSFSDMTVFTYLIYSLINQICGLINMYCFFFLLASIVKNMYRFSVISVTAMLFLNIIRITLPALSVFIPFGATDIPYTISQAVIISGLSSNNIIPIESFTVAAGMCIIAICKIISPKRNLRKYKTKI